MWQPLRRIGLFFVVHEPLDAGLTSQSRSSQTPGFSRSGRRQRQQPERFRAEQRQIHMHVCTTHTAGLMLGCGVAILSPAVKRLRKRAQSAQEALLAPFNQGKADIPAASH
jgi:hypothetical protein